MKNKLLFSIIFSFLMCNICLGATFVKAENATVIYVSADGSDSNRGSADSPLKTLNGARQAVSSHPDFRKKPIKVVFSEGTYRFDKGVSFEKGDSTIKTAPVTYMAAEGAKVVFSGSKEVDTKNFQLVTDENVLALLPENARGKVYQTYLPKEIYGAFNELDTLHYYGDNFDDKGGYTSVFVNEKEQMESQWPNGEHAYADIGTILYGGISRYTNLSSGSTPEFGPEFKYVDANPDRWTTAKYARFSGCPGHMWVHEEAAIHSVDPDSNVIKLEHSLYYGAQGTAHRIWKAFNLIEELDVPTEWYLDIETNILYYYPPEGFFEKDNNMEIITLTEPIVKLTECKNINFEGITFADSSSDFVAMLQSSTAKFTECSFINGKRRGIRAMQSIAGVYNSKFMNISSQAIVVRGTVLNWDTGETANLGTTEIIGNYFYSVGAKGRNMVHAIYTIDANRFVITNNTFHNLIGGGIIGGFAESKILYNEFYNYGQQLSDMGAFYEGQAKNKTQKEIAYNFFYDYTTKNKKLASEHTVLIQGIYMDDAANYSYIHDNIFYDGNYASMMIGGGQYNKVENNIIVDMHVMPISTDNRTETWCTSYIPRYPAQSMYVANVMDNIVKYPYVSNVPHDTVPPYGNRFADNISNGAFSFNSRVTELGDITDNITVKDKSIYANPENLDFRLKSGTALAKKYPSLSEDNFDLYNIGCDLTVTEDIDRSFNLISPVNNEENFEFNDNLLVWERADMADKYHVTVAKDGEFKDVVFDGDVTYNWHKLENLEDNTRYFWKVTAHNTSFKRKSQWESESGVLSFVTSDGKNFAVKSLENKISDVDNNFITKINEEDYEPAKITALKLNLKKIKNILKNSDKYSKEEIYSAISELDSKYQAASLAKIIRFIKLDEKYFKSDEYWTPKPTFEATEKGFKMNKSSTGNESGSLNLSELQKDNAIYQFKVKVDFKDSTANNLISFDVRRQKDGVPVWSDCGYTAIVKRGVIELQRYPSGSPVVTSVDNNFIKDGKWHEIAIGAVTHTESVQFVFMVDGKVVFNYFDEQSSAKDNGKLGIYVVNPIEFELAPSELTLDASDIITSYEYTTASAVCSLSGEWTDSAAVGFADVLVKENKGDGTVIWKLKPGKGTKEINFFKNVDAQGDNSAKITVMYDYTSASEGEEKTVSKDIDFTTGDAGWYTIDTHDVGAGEIIITLTGSGSGKLYANAVQFKEIKE